MSSVVGEWYFLRFEETATSDRTFHHLNHVVRTSFGSVAIASFVLGTIRTLKFVLYLLQKKSRSRSLGFVGSCLGFIASLVERFSSYTLVYVGLTGDSFSSSSYSCSRLFRRNLVLGLITSNLNQIVSLLGRILVAGSVGIIVFWVRVANPHTNDLPGYEWLAALISSVVPYYVMCVLTHVVDSTTDATFVCYLVDLDTNSCHSEGAHAIFSESLK